jgi:hypothetical protein
LKKAVTKIQIILDSLQKIIKSKNKNKRKITSYHYKNEERINYNFEKNVSDFSDEDSVSEYNEKNEYKNSIVKDFSEISLDDNIICALRKSYWKINEKIVKNFD